MNGIGSVRTSNVSCFQMSLYSLWTSLTGVVRFGGDETNVTMRIHDRFGDGSVMVWSGIAMNPRPLPPPPPAYFARKGHWAVAPLLPGQHTDTRLLSVWADVWCSGRRCPCSPCANRQRPLPAAPRLSNDMASDRPRRCLH